MENACDVAIYATKGICVSRWSAPAHQHSKHSEHTFGCHIDILRGCTNRQDRHHYSSTRHHDCAHSTHNTRLSRPPLHALPVSILWQAGDGEADGIAESCGAESAWPWCAVELWWCLYWRFVHLHSTPAWQPEVCSECLECWCAGALHVDAQILLVA